MSVLVLTRYPSYTYKGLDYYKNVPIEINDDDVITHLNQLGYFMCFKSWDDLPEIFKSPSVIPNHKESRTTLPEDLKDKRILLKRNGGLGDIIGTVSIVELLKSVEPSVRVSVACQNWQFPLFRLFPSIDGLVPYQDSRKFEVLYNYDAILDFIDTIENNSKRTSTDYYDLYRDMLVTRHKGVKFKGLPIQLPKIKTQFDKEIDDWLGVRGIKDFIILHTGGSSPLRKWQNEKWERLAYELTQFSDINVVITGSEYDFYIDRKDRNVYSAVGLYLDRVVSLVKKAKAVVTTDTGMVHIAGLLEKTTIGLWGNTKPESVVSYYKNHFPVSVQGCPSSPCFILKLSGCPNRKIVPLCMRSIKVNDVIEAVQRFGIVNLQTNKPQAVINVKKEIPDLEVKVVSNYKGEYYQDRYNIVLDKRTTNVLYITETEVVYSGGRYHGWMTMKALAERGFTVWVLTNKMPVFFDDFNYKEFKGKFNIIIDPSMDISRYDQKFDYIVGEPYNTCITAVEYKKNTGFGKVVNFIYETPNYIREYRKGDDSKEGFWTACKQSLLESDIVVTLSELGVKKMKEWDKLFEDKVIIPIEPACNNIVGDKIVLLGKMAKKDYDVIYISMVKDYKNHLFLLESLSKIFEKCRVALVGYRASHIKSKYRFSNLEVSTFENINDEDKFKLIKASKMMIVPSKFEGFGMTPFEAMLVKIPVFCSDLPILKENYKEHVNYFKLDDFNSLAKEVLDYKNAVYHKLLQPARDYALENFSIPALMDRTKRIFDKKPVLKKEKLRLGVVVSWSEKCGIAENTKYYIDGLKDYEDIKIYAPTDGKIYGKDNTDLVRRVWSRDFKDYQRLLDDIKKYGTNVIHIHHEFSFYQDTNNFIRFIKTLKEMGIRVVITYHTYYIDVGFHKTVNALVDKELVCNSAAAVKAREATGNRSIGCIPLPCLQYDNVDIETARKKLNIPLDKKIVASHGFFQQHKGYDCLVKSLAYMGNNTEIWIIGAGDVKHECYQHIRYLIKNLKIKSKVKIFDQYLTMDKVMEKLQCANIIAYAYTIKGYYSASAAARTGLSCGRPCVVSHSPMFEDIFPITKQFPMLDSRALAEISNNLIGDKKESDKLVKKSMEYVRSYPPEKISQLHNELYLNLL